ncbi:hypothetical protein MW871_10995 [Flavobacterium sp. I-SCBP12n]|uniref:Lipoprotein n=1 Tax=Flavobacterium pygoscelis TaxID=2893176 RepID=A0A9X2BM19_9FLAO|nr:hypothetical protein [Flavobacterium pygoscelis]MCK8142418.1 hypothetical protein [Flavobacterium pygoscelis]
MKKTILNLALTTFIVATVLVGCQDKSKQEAEAKENVENAKENLDDAKAELSDARRAATEQEWQAFKDSTNATIKQNEIRIGEMKAELKKTGKTIDSEYSKNIQELEEKNKEIKNKLEVYKNNTNSDWQSFKKEFRHDMDDLGQSLKNFTVKDKK